MDLMMEANAMHFLLLSSSAKNKWFSITAMPRNAKEHEEKKQLLLAATNLAKLHGWEEADDDAVASTATRVLYSGAPYDIKTINDVNSEEEQ